MQEMTQEQIDVEEETFIARGWLMDAEASRDWVQINAARDLFEECLDKRFKAWNPKADWR